MSQFNSLRNRGNYANAGRAAADNALGAFIAARKYSPNYSKLVEKGAQLRSEQKKALLKIESELTKRKIKIDTAVEVAEIESNALGEIDRNQRMAGKIAAAGQKVGYGLFKMGQKPQERIDSNSSIDLLKTQEEQLRTRAQEIKDGIPTFSTNTSGNNTGNQQGGNSSGKALEPAAISFNPNISKLSRQKLDIIGKYESDSVGGYNAINQIGVADGRGVLGYSGDIRKMNQHGGRELTDFSVGEIIDLQADPGKSMSNDDWIKSGKLHAVGRYQFIGPTFKSEVQRQGIDLNAKFTPQLQDQIALGYLNHVGSASPWVGPMDKASADELNILNTF